MQRVVTTSVEQYDEVDALNSKIGIAAIWNSDTQQRTPNVIFWTNATPAQLNGLSFTPITLTGQNINRVDTAAGAHGEAARGQNWMSFYRSGKVFRVDLWFDTATIAGLLA